MTESADTNIFSIGGLRSQTRLQDCARIIVGLEYEELIKTDQPGPYRELQIKHLAPDQPVPFEILPPIHLKRDPITQIVRNGDVLFTARNQRKIAVPVLSVPKNIVVRSSIYILRVDPQRLDPEYLAWYLNQPRLQSYLEQRAKGSNVAVISRIEAARIPVLLPSLAQQKAFVRVHQLRLAETRLQQELEAQQNRLLDMLLFQRLAALVQENVVTS